MYVLDCIFDSSFVVCRTPSLLSWAELRLQVASLARLIGRDGKWSVVVKLYRRVCTMSIHIFTFMNVYVQCTYKYINSCTCMYYAHTNVLMYVHVHNMYIHVYDFMNVYKHVCTMFRHIHTDLPYPVQVVRIPDAWNHVYNKKSWVNHK